MREAALCFFYNVAGCLKEKFAIFIEKLVGFTINLANLENEVEKSAPKAKKEFSLDSDSEEEDEETINDANPFSKHLRVSKSPAPPLRGSEVP